MCVNCMQYLKEKKERNVIIGRIFECRRENSHACGGGGGGEGADEGRT